MPLFFLFVGIMLIIVGINNKLPELGALIKEDFRPSQTGVPGFHYWVLAIFMAGAVGYYRPARPLSNAFLVLIMVVMILSNRGFFDKFSQALKG